MCGQATGYAINPYAASGDTPQTDVLSFSIGADGSSVAVDGLDQSAPIVFVMPSKEPILMPELTQSVFPANCSYAGQVRRAVVTAWRGGIVPLA